jgi:lipoate-protein ligase A
MYCLYVSSFIQNEMDTMGKVRYDVVVTYRRRVVEKVRYDVVVTYRKSTGTAYLYRRYW